MSISAAKFAGNYPLKSRKNDEIRSDRAFSGQFPRLPANFRGNSISVRSEVRDDGYYMRRCVDLARKAVGCTSPNPMVGCVIVKRGEIVGEGFHPKAGQPHAEVFALRDAGDQAEEATAYVSLEPCNHYGRTPPCTEALIKAKVKRVVVGMVDPNPIVASTGVERLRGAGIEVAVGIEEALCKRLNEAYIHRMLSRKPFVTLSYTLAINGGGIVDHIEEREKELGGYFSRLLQESDGVIVSGSSLDQDSTLPTSQEPGANQPSIIIIVPKGGPPLSIPASIDPSRRIMIFLESGATIAQESENMLNLLGIEKVVLDELRLTPILEYCYGQGMCSVLLDLSSGFQSTNDLLREAVLEGLVQKAVVQLSDSEKVKQMEWPFHLRHLQSVPSKSSIVVEGYII